MPKVRQPDKGYSRRMRNLPLSQTLGKESKRSMGTSDTLETFGDIFFRKKRIFGNV
jgi:hypothetical protein